MKKKRDRAKEIVYGLKTNKTTKKAPFFNETL